MPFTKLADIKTFEKYKSILKTELGKLSNQRVKYHYFEKVKLEGGSKEGDPFILVGTYPPAMVDELKKAGGEYKARGAIGEAEDKSLEYTVQHGTLKATALKHALAEVKTLTVKEVEPAQGEVVATQGGREGNADADARADDLKAQYDKLRAGYEKTASQMAETVRREIRASLLAADAALKAKDGKTAAGHMTTATMQMTAYARERQLAVAKATDAPLEVAATAAVAELERVGQAQTDVNDLPLSIENAEKMVQEADLGLRNALKSIKSQGAPVKGKAPQEPASVRNARATLAAANLQVQALRKQLNASKAELAKNPKLAQELVTRWQNMSKKIEAAENDCKVWLDKMGFGAPTPGSIDKAPGLNEARNALDGKLSGIADSKKKLVDLVAKHRDAALQLKADHGDLAKAVLALTGQSLSTAVLGPFEQEVKALQERFDEGPDPKDLTRDAALSKMAADATAWLKVRSEQVAQVNALGIPGKYTTHMAAKWGASDATMKSAKTQLDGLLAGAEAVDAGKLKPLLTKLGSAGVPSWNAAWLKAQEDALKPLAGKPAPFDDMVAWAREAYRKERDQVDGPDHKKGLAKVDTLVLAELKKRMKVLVEQTAVTFGELQETERKAAVVTLNNQIAAMSKLEQATSVLEQFRYSVAWDFEEKLKQQLARQHNAQELARRPTRAQWAAHLGIAENGYIMRPTPLTFELNGQTHSTHFTVSYDSVTAAQPRIFQAPAASVLTAAFMAGVPTAMQAHATIDFPNSADNPHLYLTGNIWPKNLTGDDIARANAVLVQVRTQLIAWLNERITSFQNTIH